MKHERRAKDLHLPLVSCIASSGSQGEEDERPGEAHGGCEVCSGPLTPSAPESKKEITLFKGVESVQGFQEEVRGGGGTARRSTSPFEHSNKLSRLVRISPGPAPPNDQRFIWPYLY